MVLRNGQDCLGHPQMIGRIQLYVRGWVVYITGVTAGNLEGQANSGGWMSS